jgi:hypothetical protein
MTAEAALSIEKLLNNIPKSLPGLLGVRFCIWTLKWIVLSTADCNCTCIEIAVGFTRFFQRLFDLAPVVAGVLIHLPALTAILLSTVAGF